MILPVDYTKLPWKEKRTVREEYVKLQKGMCMFCQSSLTESPPVAISDKDINWDMFPPNFLKHPIHLQHCHETNMTEGAVHAYCNAVLWQYHGR